MEYGSLFGVAVIAALLVVLYWVYSFAIAPFRVLARYGVQGPSPVPFYGNQRMADKMGKLKFIVHTIKEYGPIHGYVKSYLLCTAQHCPPYILAYRDTCTCMLQVLHWPETCCVDCRPGPPERGDSETV